jgi:hypothetical protein
LNARGPHHRPYPPPRREHIRDTAKTTTTTQMCQTSHKPGQLQKENDELGVVHPPPKVRRLFLTPAHLLLTQTSNARGPHHRPYHHDANTLASEPSQPLQPRGEHVRVLTTTPKGHTNANHGHERSCDGEDRRIRRIRRIRRSERGAMQEEGTRRAGGEERKE